jgi:endonuclease/exonuclease/phosphatase family metal-dependent hydrolase
MQIISWNIQAAKGVDEVISVDRIARVVKALGNADVICFQEVLNCEVDGTEANQVQALSAHFPQHDVYFGAAIDRLQAPARRGGARLQFGNLVLSRLPVVQQHLHRLPQPAEAGIPCMPRQAIELVVPMNKDGQLCRIVTTHLDYFAAKQRSAQVRYLCELNRETLDRAKRPGAQGGEMQFAALAETDLSVYCGDFNLGVDSEDYDLLTSASDAALLDCWRLINGDKPHLPTCGIFDRVQWSEGPHCRDFFFASTALAPHVQAVDVDTETDASDHQPLMLTLA